MVGSITHCRGYRGAAVARAAEVPGIGVDAEPHLPLPERLLALVALASERDGLREMA
jgi:4'-phosphopantetheinyl transferase EntD